jgi:hypothetical protein
MEYTSGKPNADEPDGPGRQRSYQPLRHMREGQTVPKEAAAEGEHLTIELDDDEFSQLILMSGYAWGAAMKADDSELARLFLILANRINKNNPKWTPYEIPPAKEQN